MDIAHNERESEYLSVANFLLEAEAVLVILLETEKIVQLFNNILICRKLTSITNISGLESTRFRMSKKAS